MNFELAEEHRMLKDLVRKFVDTQLVPLEAEVLARDTAGKGSYLTKDEQAKVDAVHAEAGGVGGERSVHDLVGQPALGLGGAQSAPAAPTGYQQYLAARRIPLAFLGAGLALPFRRTVDAGL